MDRDPNDLINKYAPSLNKYQGQRSMTLGYDQFRREQFITKMNSAKAAKQRELDEFYEKWKAGEVDHPSMGSYKEYSDRQRAEKRGKQFLGEAAEEKKTDVVPGREKARLKKMLKSMTKEELLALQEEDAVSPEQNTSQSAPEKPPQDDPSVEASKSSDPEEA